MLTRLEVDGFKNLLGLRVDFGPFTCIAVNTHSPYLVQLIDRDDLLFASTRLGRAPDGSIVPMLSLRPLVGTWRAAYHDEPGAVVTLADILPYLAAPPRAQLSLDEV